MTKPSLGTRLEALFGAARRSFKNAIAQRLGARKMLGKGLKALALGPRGFARKVIAYDQAAMRPGDSHSNAPRTEPSQYEAWLEAAELRPATVLQGARISVVMPVCETPERFLREAVASVQNQSYEDWELCVYDDASSCKDVGRVLAELQSQEPRLRVAYGERRSGIAAATNGALALATGTMVAFLDHDDLLHPEALASVVAAFSTTGANIVYTDHDVLGEDGRRKDPYFKPDWSLDLFLSQMYLGHLVAFERTLLEQVGGLRPAFDGAQDYDLVLRCIAAGARVTHVPRVLYHWRQHSGSTSANADSKPYAHHAGRAALQEFVDSCYPGAKVEDSPYTFCYDVRYPSDGSPLVSLVIPTRDRIDLLDVCLKTLLERTAYSPFEVLIVDNGSVQPQTHEWFVKASKDPRVRVIPADVPFNWSVLNNMAAQQARGEILVFLNNDTEITDADWLQRLVEISLRSDVGICGPLLLYGDGSIQHAGVVVGMGGWADHVFKGQAPVHHQHLFTSPLMRRNVLAVTGACMAVEKRKFDALGGFDETFIVCGSDVELGLRALGNGLCNVYVAEARMLHHESKTRDPQAIPEADFHRSAEAYAPYRTEGDPLYNPNLDQMSTTPRLRACP